MLQILARQHLPVLAEYASTNVLLAFDFDGTLAPIAPHPPQARMRAGTRRLLAALTRRYPVVVISGRAREDLVRLVDAVPVWHLAGNHGVEPWGQDPRYAAHVQRWADHLEQRLRSYPGVFIENKTYSLTVHYRHAQPRANARAAIRRAIHALRGVRVIGGKNAFSLLPRDAPHKGSALVRARRLLGCETAIYIGDDDTDEDAFALARTDRVLAIRVGRARDSNAPYCLTNQKSVDELLRKLIMLRPLQGAS
jgi:trehalose 6-phosphate phosphatase